MPQLCKDGKYAFGWSIVGKDGKIDIPPEAFEEIQFEDGYSAILMSGSRTSGGFALGRFEILQHSPIASFPGISNTIKCDIPEGEIIKFKHHILCLTRIEEGVITPSGRIAIQIWNPIR